MLTRPSLLLLLLVACSPEAATSVDDAQQALTVTAVAAEATPAVATPVRTDPALRQRLTAAGLRPLPPAPPVSDALFNLGQALAFDKELSGNRDTSCMTCHHPQLGSDDDRSLPAGAGGQGLGADRVGGETIARSAPPLFNLHVPRAMFWDGRVARRPDGSFDTPAGPALTPGMQATLTFGAAAAQAMFPVTNAAEMRGAPGSNELADLADTDFAGIWSALMDRLGAIPAYVDLFEAAYPGQSFANMTFAHAANAIAGFEIRAFEATGSPVERYLNGDDAALDPLAQRGAAAFVTGGCARCHSGPGLSDQVPHTLALPQIGPGTGGGPSGLEDLGTFDITGDPRHRYAFKTPMLTQVAETGPWGHAGQYNTLEGFIGHYRNAPADLRDYDPQASLDDPALWSQHVTAADAAMLANLAPQLRGPQPPINVAAIETFLRALTDPSASDLSWTVPGEVPSGADVEWVGTP
jgi:cytochrome c peroxidase